MGSQSNTHQIEFSPAADRSTQAVLVEALLNPAVYGADIDRVEKLETHISYVFLAGGYAYKVKKAVDLGFLNFETLAARRHFCEQELRLNRRLAPALYVEVVPITGTPDRPVLGGVGAPIEYAVKMRRFPQEDLLGRLLERGQLTPPHFDQLAAKIAEFHAAIGVAPAIETFGSTEAIRKPALENFAQVRAALTGTVDRPDLDALEQWTVRRCRLLEPVFRERKRGGFVRECHGDLHLGNMALFDGALTIFDCIEFNDTLRWIDVMSEAAFLVMDLHDRKRPDLAQRFLNRYLEITGDYDGLRVLRFYVVYRALVRAKVHCLRANQPNVMAQDKDRLLAQYRHYVAVAKSHTSEICPSIFITHGLSGSGKTTCTESLLETCGAVRVRSDLERKRLHSVPALARTASGIGEGLYAEEATASTYHRLLELAKSIVENGYPAIVDATFLKRSQRDAFRDLAAALGVPFHILDFVADEATLRNRILARQRHGADASEANIAVLEYQLRTREPLQADELRAVVKYDAISPLL